MTEHIDEMNGLMDDMFSALLEQYRKMGFKEEHILEFLCLRMHHDHAWGLARIIVNGVESAGIVAPSRDNTNMRVVFIPVPAGTKITDMFYNEAQSEAYELPLNPVPEKQQIN